MTKADRQRLYKTRYRRRHRKQIRAYDRAWGDANPDAKRAIKLRWYRAHHAEILERQRVNRASGKWSR